MIEQPSRLIKLALIALAFLCVDAAQAQMQGPPRPPAMASKPPIETLPAKQAENETPKSSPATETNPATPNSVKSAPSAPKAASDTAKTAPETAKEVMKGVPAASTNGKTTKFDPAVRRVAANPNLANLPNYGMDIELDTQCKRAKVHQTVRWKNPSCKPTDELVFHVYPRHKPNKKQLEIYERTIESFRLDPRVGVDYEGRHINVSGVSSGKQGLRFSFDDDPDTILRVKLPFQVTQGQSVEVELYYELSIPKLQGRLGQWKGVTNLLNWYPILAYYDDSGWDATPFTGWHQPWFNEAGNYDVNLTLPNSEVVASSGWLESKTELGDGRQQLHLTATGLRDFSIVTSKFFEEHETDVNGVKIRILALPGHRYYARHMLQICVECMHLYEEWFGPYAYPQFTIADSFFGWNGNETGAMVLIDERVFAAPTLANVYVDHLISHEFCHQWWYGAVGTDGFRETFMDEGLVSYFTQLRITRKYGSNVQLLDWPCPVHWLPNVCYENFMQSGYMMYLRRGGHGQVLDTMENIGHVYNLFFLAYGRGAKVVSMVHQRLGDDAFFDFFRRVYAKYKFGIFFAADFQKELEDYTGESWQQFFDDWLRSGKNCDWALQKVDINRTDDHGFEVRVRVKQKAEINEPVEIGCRSKEDGPVDCRILLDPRTCEQSCGPCASRKVGDNEWEVTFLTTHRPQQVEIDPDRRICESDMLNNRWKREPEYRLTPLFTPFDEISMAYPLERLSIAAGPNVDVDGRLGLRSAFIVPNRYRISPFLAYDSTDAQSSIGVDAEIYNSPAPNFSIGFRYDHTLESALYNQPTDEGKLYLRWHQAYTTSFIYPDNAYVEGFMRFGDNFYVDEDFRPPTRAGVEDYRKIRAVGLSVHVDTYLPYWNPEKGWRFDGTYEYGFRAFNAGESYQRIYGQLGAVQRMPDGYGWFSETRMAARISGGYGSPDNGEHFRFGGPLRFRGQRSEDTEGSAYWLSTAEWRVPVLGDLDGKTFDNVANLKSIYGSLFYDVGDSFLFGSTLGLDHAIGAGLYFHIHLFSFVEILTIRFELSHSLRTDVNVGWVGLYHAF